LRLLWLRKLVDPVFSLIVSKILTTLKLLAYACMAHCRILSLSHTVFILILNVVLINLAEKLIFKIKFDLIIAILSDIRLYLEFFNRFQILKHI